MNAKKLSMKKNIHEYFFSSTIFYLFFIDKKIVDEIRSDPLNIKFDRVFSGEKWSDQSLIQSNYQLV